MYNFTIPGDIEISCKLFMYNNNLFSVPVVIYYFCDDELDKHIDFCDKLMNEAACHVILVTNMDVMHYKQKIKRLIDFVYLEMNIDILQLVILGRRWATICVSETIYYCNQMYNENPYSLIFIYPEQHNIKKVKDKLFYCTKSVVLFIDDNKNEYSEELNKYIISISLLDFPTFTNYISDKIDISRDIITPCRYVIRPMYIKPSTKYKMPSNIQFVQTEIIPKLPKYKEYMNKIHLKYAEMKKLLY